MESVLYIGRNRTINNNNQSCERVSEAFDWIEQVFHDMREFSERLEVYARRKIDPLLEKQVVGILAL
jgi:hypothetical protein